MSPADSDIPEHFQVVHLDLAPESRERESGDPSGSAGDRYTLLLPLGPDGRILEAQARRHPDFCRVSRLDGGGAVLRGLMRPGPAGTWRLDFGEAGPAGVRLGATRFIPGDHVTLLGDGRPRPYRVIALQPL